ncbi:MAG: methylenetetrahydrofolate reductase [NAD(P)H] [Chloroflexi bacterium]|nr:methylenetetrahydrofolate reductase [NAD(P)H] [Chloroflexota bacterium]
MRIADVFGRGQPVFSFEFFPPKTPEGVAALYRTVEHDLKPLGPTFVSVTYGAGGSTQDLTVELVSNIKHQLGLETMCHLTCVGHSSTEIAGLLDRLRDAGIENVLPLRGDPPRGQDNFVRPEGGFGYAQELVRFIRSAGYDFCLGGACYPEGHPDSPSLDFDLERLKEKAASGSEFLITQLFFDPALYFDLVERARVAGIQQPIVPGVLPVLSLPQIERFTSLCGATIPAALRVRLEACGDDAEVVQAGIDWAVEQCVALLEGGAPGIHFYTLNRSQSVKAILESLPAPIA